MTPGQRAEARIAELGITEPRDLDVDLIAMDAGMEVVYTGLHLSPQDIVTAAIDEDVDVIALSLLSGAHMTLVPAVLDLLASQSASDIAVMVGGIIPPADAEALKARGVLAVFGPGTPTDAIVQAITTAVG